MKYMMRQKMGCCGNVLQGCDTEAEVNCCFVLCYAMLNGMVWYGMVNVNLYCALSRSL